MTSCVSDDFNVPGGAMKEYSGTIRFDLSTPDMADRTRAVNMQSGSNVLIKNLWLGVFDISTGECFGAMKQEDMNASIISGSVLKNMLTVDFIAKGVNPPLAYVVAVANYDGVTTWDGQEISEILPDFDNRTEISWDKIINIGIDTSSAYRGAKGEDYNANAPFMAGFYQDAVSLTQNPKIDQFSYEQYGPSAIYPASAAEGIDLKLGQADSNSAYVAAGAICLRRLVSHNVLNFNLSKGYELTSVKYRRFNMPRYVFLLQRRTDTTKRSNFSDWQKNSPNFADHLLSETGYGNPEDPSFPYESDKEWIETSIVSKDNASNIEIEFDHFENKHWGFGNLTSQDDREALNPDGTFSALCEGSYDAYNNFASYFVLGLHIINRETGESADIEYTLHEGFCNDDDGRRANTLEEKCHDFGSFRNVNYTYNINISGIDDITTSVTSDEGRHPNGQAGNIWKMEFATGSGNVKVPINGGDFDFNGKYMAFGSNPNLGFRICGVDGNGQPVDICYNMPEGMYQGFSGLWSIGKPTYVTSPDTAIPGTLLNGMKICSRNGGEYNISNFIKGINNGEIDSTEGFFFRFTPYNGKELGLIENISRGLYIFDRNDVRNACDSDGCSSYNVAYGAVQYPFNVESLTFDINKILVWDNEYYKATSKVEKLYAASTPIFYGALSSAIDMRWKHDPRIRGYKITVFNSTYTHPTIVIGAEDIIQYLQDFQGGQLFVYPLNTASFPKGTGTGATNYSFSVMPIVDEEMYQMEILATDVIHNTNKDDATCIRVCPTLWNINKNGSNDWKNVLPIGGLKSFEVFYRGLHTISTSEIGNYPSTDFLCFGLSGNITDRYFSFVASVPGKFIVTCKSHNGKSEPTRQLYIGRIDETGSQINGDLRYDIVYQSNSMPGSKTSFTTPLLKLKGNNEPTEFRIYAGGSIDYYSIEFVPN